MRRILVVDDEAAVRRFLRAALGTKYEINEACNGIEALMRYESCRPDLVICDVCMPQMDGREFARRVCNYDPTASIVFITGFGDTRGLPGLILEKPFTLKQLTDVIDRGLGASNGSQGQAALFSRVQLMQEIVSFRFRRPQWFPDPDLFRFRPSWYRMATADPDDGSAT